MDRPTGVTILGVLYIIAGIVWISLAVLIGVLSSSFMGSSMMGGMAAIGGFIAGVAAIAAIIEFIIVGALFSGKSWGRIIVIVFAIIDLIIEVISLFGMNVFAIVFIILDVIVLYYMWRPHVIEYFKGSRRHKMCVYCGYLAESERELHNHHIICEKKKQHDENRN